MTDLMEPQVIKTYKFYVKDAKEDGTIEGYASVFGNVDSDDEVVDKGAFKKTLTDSKGVVPILWNHDRVTPCGWGLEAFEDDHGLRVRAKMFMDTEQGRYAYSFVKNGLEAGGKPGLSIGFRVTKGGEKVENGRRHFTDVQLMEWSICTFQSNLLATIDQAKGAISSDLPLASEDLSWDGDAARARVAKWAGGGDDLAKMNWNRYRRAFLWVDSSKPDLVGSYKLPIGDVFSGTLKAVPKAIFAAAGGHGVNAASIPEADKAKIRTTLTRYYKRLKRDSPFGKEGGGEMLEFKSSDFTDELARSEALDGHYELKWKMSRALDKAIDGICADTETEKEDKKPLIHKCLADHAECMKDWWSRFLDITQPDSGKPVDDDEGEEMAQIVQLLAKGGRLNEKQGRVISAATKMKLSKAMGHIKDSMGHSEASAQLKAKALGILTDLSTGRYWNDVNAPNPVGAGAPSKPEPATNHPIGGGAPKNGPSTEELKALGDSLEKLKERFNKPLQVAQK